MSDDDQAAESLLAFRRDAVAAILMCLYVLAGALRGNRPIPVRSTRYFPLLFFFIIARSPFVIEVFMVFG